MADKPKHIGMIAHIDAGKTTLTAAISRIVAQPATPPVDGLEVVAWDVAPKGLPAEPTKSHSFVAEIERQGGSITPLVTLSKASSVIAGLRKERITAERDALDAYGKLQIAEARISSLEEENKRLREVLKPFAEAGDNTDANDDYSSASIWEHPCAMDITIGDLRRARRICPQTEDHNG